MASQNLRNIKRAQKESQLLREVSTLVMQATMDEASLQGIYVSKVNLSQDKGKLYVLFTTAGGKEEFTDKLGTLILYKPSMRAALAKNLDFRYTPDLVFKYDGVSDKQKRMEELFYKIANPETFIPTEPQN
ncbi:MAG: ribosome-binding factor A [Candidatus Babeliales bacterium]|nr:ribosome-binding factor A [Candidatus Babeliales bacterium]